MMSQGLSQFTIAPFVTGLDTDLEPWLLPPDSFTEIDNIHVKHGYIQRRNGFNVFGALIPNAVTVAINNVTQANPGQVTTGAAHGLTTGDLVFIASVGGMTEKNNKIFTVTVVDGTNFTINKDTTSFTAYTLGGTMALVDPTVDRVMGITRFLKSDGIYELLAMNTTRASVYNGLTNSFDQLDAANIMSGDEFDYIWAENWQSSGVVNRLYFTNGKAFDGASLDGIRYYDGTGGITTSFVPELTPSSAAVGTKRFLYGGQILFVIKERLVVLNTFEHNNATATTSQHPQRARWCQAQGPSNWDDITPGGGGFVDAPTGQQIISARPLQDVIIVIFTDSVWTLRPIGDPALPFRWDKINDYRACDGKMATVGYDRDMRALGVRGITATDGVETRRIDQRIENFTIDEINVSQFKKVYCARSYGERRWWTLYSANKDNEDGENNSALIWDDESRAYSTYSIALNCLGYGNAGYDYGLNDFTAANNLDWSLVAEAGEEGPGEETLQSFFFQDTQEIFLGGDINGRIFGLETGITDAGASIGADFTTAAWNPFKDQGLASKLVYVDIFLDTDTQTSAVIEFIKDNDITPYGFEALDFMPNLGYIASIVDIDLTNPVNINAPSNGLSTGDTVFIYSVKGTVEVNDGPYLITVVDENNFTLDGVDGTGFTPHVAGGKVYQRQFYKAKEWKRVYAGGSGYEHRLKFTLAVSAGPFRIHAFRPYFKLAGRTVN
jgi:hypothetical protein